MILESAFFFWPVHSIQSSGGWLYGIYATIQSVPYRELLKSGQRRFGRRIKDRIPEPTNAQVARSFLMYENLGTAIEGATLRETFMLDLEQHTMPTTRVTEKKAKEALQDFLNLKDGRTEDAVDFIRKYGEFDLVDVSKDALKDADAPAEVRAFCEESQHGPMPRDPFVLALDDFWKVRIDILGLWNLAGALNREDLDAVRAECRHRRPKSTFKGEPAWLAVGKAILCADLSASINEARIRPRILLSQRDDNFCALTVCDTIRTGLYVQLLKMVVSRTEYRQCESCGNHFPVTVRGKKFCSKPCQNAAKVRKWRKKRKKEADSARSQQTLKGNHTP
jgi:hypothetical protein